MRITRFGVERTHVPLPEPFTVSLGVIDSADLAIVTLETDDGLVGYGEGSPTPFVTGETGESVLAALKLFEPLLLGADPFAIDAIHRGMDQILVRNGSAKAAVDLALHDLCAKAAGLPLYRYLGGASGSVEVDMTIGLGEPEAMAAAAAGLVAKGYRRIKVKAGADEARDVAAIRLIREAAPEAQLQVDANQGWDVATALRMLAVYADLGVVACEQPLPFWDLDGTAYLRRRSPVPIMVDEGCFTPQDASAIVRRQAADTVNIKLMKCGGIHRARQINTIAESAGVTCMIGCMLESRLAIAAGAHLAAATPNIVLADLDSFLDFDDSPLVASAFAFDPPWIHLPDAPGLGVELA
ncbi:MAG: dipeptide epimerase [Propionibacteriaceae bacterium]|jgi:L-alanine-DL-glutamate epimerase-like enolase superfamily enzyme|nr:dipeptide epimerase [Propionibacteriaceae bacterium]